MKKSLLKIFILFNLIFISNFSFSQDLKEFQKDSIFIEQFEEFVEKNIAEEKGDSLKSFVEKWNSIYFSTEIKDRFIDICNLMLQNKASRDPHFTRYFDIVMTFHRSENAMQHYDSWEKGIQYIFETQEYPLRLLTQYFDNTKSLIEENLIFSTYSTNWYVSSDKYEFIVDESLRIRFDNTDLTCKIKNDSINIFNTKGVFNPLTSL